MPRLVISVHLVFFRDAAKLPGDIKRCHALIKDLRAELRATRMENAKLQADVERSRDAAREIGHLEELIARQQETISEQELTIETLAAASSKPAITSARRLKHEPRCRASDNCSTSKTNIARAVNRCDLAVRREESKPIVEAFHDWLWAELLRQLPKSKLAGAINYMLNRWESFARFLESGAVPMDNNAAERALKYHRSTSRI